MCMPSLSFIELETALHSSGAFYLLSFSRVYAMIWRQYTHILGLRLREMAIVNIYTPFLSQGDSKSRSRNVPSTDILHTQPLGALSDHR